METAGLIPKVFNYDSHQVEVVMIDDAPYWVAKDVCDILGLGQADKSVKRLDDDEKLTVILIRSGQNRNVWVVSESGLYNLIFQSRKSEAKKFRKWVTSEVLPTIRKTGEYKIKPTLVELPILYATHENGYTIRSAYHKNELLINLQDLLRAIGSKSSAGNLATSHWLKLYCRKVRVQTFSHAVWWVSKAGEIYVRMRKSTEAIASGQLSLIFHQQAPAPTPNGTQANS
jgi:prophage antirepressor-like protein